MKDDCPYLEAEAHDGHWQMSCLFGAECNHNYEEYSTCAVYKKKKEGRKRVVKKLPGLIMNE